MNSKPVKEYLRELLSSQIDYTFTRKEERKIKRDKIAFIVEKLTRKKYRRKKVSIERKKDILEKVKLSVGNKKPLHLVIPFGGYKHFWNKSHPEPDWAEIFNMLFMSQYLAPIIKIYKPGAIVEYISEDLILPRMNNYPPEALGKYADIFSRLINLFNENVPPNLKFRFFRVGDRCNKNELIKEVENLLEKRRKKFRELSDTKKDIELKRSRRSIMWDGKEKLSGLSKQEKIERQIDSRIIELAYYETEEKPDYLGDYLIGHNHICICFSFGLSPDNDEIDFLTLGSSHGGIVDFWIGRGILEARKKKIFPKIVSKNQYKSIENKLKIIKLKKLIPFKNFREIEILYSDGR